MLTLRGSSTITFFRPERPRNVDVEPQATFKQVLIDYDYGSSFEVHRVQFSTAGVAEGKDEGFFSLVLDCLLKLSPVVVNILGPLHAWPNINRQTDASPRGRPYWPSVTAIILTSPFPSSAVPSGHPTRQLDLLCGFGADHRRNVDAWTSLLAWLGAVIEETDPPSDLIIDLADEDRESAFWDALPNELVSLGIAVDAPTPTFKFDKLREVIVPYDVLRPLRDVVRHAGLNESLLVRLRSVRLCSIHNPPALILLSLQTTRPSLIITWGRVAEACTVRTRQPSHSFTKH